MVECTALEMRHTREGIEGSNPSLSANISLQTNEMGLPGPENPQRPRDFADAVRTPETGELGQSGL